MEKTCCICYGKSENKIYEMKDKDYICKGCLDLKSRLQEKLGDGCIKNISEILSEEGFESYGIDCL